MRPLHFFYTTTKILRITTQAIGALHVFLSNFLKIISSILRIYVILMLFPSSELVVQENCMHVNFRHSFLES